MPFFGHILVEQSVWSNTQILMYDLQLKIPLARALVSRAIAGVLSGKKIEAIIKI